MIIPHKKNLQVWNILFFWNQ